MNSVGRTELVRHILDRIAAAEVDPSPFAHIIVDELLPSDFYEELLASVPPTDTMQRVSYPGTGYGKRSADAVDYGFAFPDLKSAGGPLGIVREVFASAEFSRALLEKFVSAIPSEKHRYFNDGATDFSTVFDLQVDLPGYAIAPHPDIESKIVTFQLYLSNDETLAKQGTFLCAPKDLRAARGRTDAAIAVGRVISTITKPFPSVATRIERSRIGEFGGIGAQRSWLPWSWFDVAKVSPALPNHFLAFAPNELSYHAVSMDGLKGERPVIRGFIRSGADTTNWIAPRM